MPRIAGISWSKWFTCDRCGREYPISYRRHQNGLSVCTYIPCWDNEPSTTPEPNTPEAPTLEDTFLITLASS